MRIWPAAIGQPRCAGKPVINGFDAVTQIFGAIDETLAMAAVI
jgi:hypothetical protein